jgi:hypothetical protein
MVFSYLGILLDLEYTKERIIKLNVAEKSQYASVPGQEEATIEDTPDTIEKNRSYMRLPGIHHVVYNEAE